MNGPLKEEENDGGWVVFSPRMVKDRLSEKTSFEYIVSMLRAETVWRWPWLSEGI